MSMSHFLIPIPNANKLEVMCRTLLSHAGKEGHKRHGACPKYYELFFKTNVCDVHLICSLLYANSCERGRQRLQLMR
jgi:hypothetical protein